MVHHEHGPFMVFATRLFGVIGVFFTRVGCATTLLSTILFQVDVFATISTLNCAVLFISNIVRAILLVTCSCLDWLGMVLGMLLTPFFDHAC